MYIDEIRNKVESKKTINDDEYSDFKKDYPKIYEMWLSKNFNKAQMKFFLSNLQKIENNETSDTASIKDNKANDSAKQQKNAKKKLLKFLKRQSILTVT